MNDYVKKGNVSAAAPNDIHRCQFCTEETHAREWREDHCPKCGRKYDPILAQEMDDG